jgi:hypothetical protein
MKYLKHLNRHQREVYRHHVHVDAWRMEEYEGWCYQMFGGKRKRWQNLHYVSSTRADKCKGLFLFKHESDAMLFQLRWQ